VSHPPEEPIQPCDVAPAAEAAAMVTCWQALDALPSDARRRVIAWLQARQCDVLAAAAVEQLRGQDHLLELERRGFFPRGKS
jgi:hypothetical protein